MAVDLISRKSEANILYSICEGTPKCREYIISRLEKGYVAYPSLSKALRRLLTLTEKNKGKPPRWNSLCQDPVFDDTTKIFLEKLEPKLITTRKEANGTLELLKEYHNRRLLFNLNEYIEDILTEAPDNQLDSAEIADLLIHKLDNIKRSVNTEYRDFKLSDDTSRGIVDALIHAKEPDLLLTGFHGFDKETGGLPNGSVTLLAGTTGSGKSNLAMNMALNFLRQKSVMYVPLEMTEMEMWGRVLSRETRVPYARIARVKLTDKEKTKLENAYDKLKNKYDDNGNDFIIHAPDEDVTMGEVLSAALLNNVDVVVVDYMSLLKGMDGDDAWQALSAATRKAKIWAKIHNKRVIVLAQLSDEGKVRYSKAMVEHANTAWVWSREADSEDMEVQIRQIKARGHSPAPFYLQFELETCYVGDARNEYTSEKEPDRSKVKRVTIEEAEGYLDEDDEDVVTPRRRKLAKQKPVKHRELEEDDEDDGRTQRKTAKHWR